jgi:hypothetical protein
LPQEEREKMEREEEEDLRGLSDTGEGEIDKHRGLKAYGGEGKRKRIEFVR